MATSVSDLLKTPFLKRPRVEQQQIVAGGRPRFLQKLPKSDQDESLCNPVVFDQVQWLTRCDGSRKLYCWTCLLFMPSVAMLRGRKNSHLMLEITNNHESTVEHIEAALKLQIFISRNFRTTVRVADKTQHNIVVKRNREILKRVIDAVLSAVARKHSLGDGKYSYNRIDAEDCLTFLQLLRNCDKLNVDLVDGAIDFLNRYPRIANDLVDAITRVVKTEIKNETHKSTYVSLILSQHGMSNGRSQLSTVLRYIKQGRVNERFIGFTNVIGCNSKKDILKLIQNTIEEYSISDRFLALSLDGEVLPKQSLTSLIASIKIDYHYSYFVPWHSHGFGNILLQTLLAFKECSLFLKTMKSFEIFFQSSTRLESLEVFLQKKVPTLQSDKWHKTSPFIIFVCTYRTYFIEFFGSMLKNCKNWEADDITKAVGFRIFLLQFHTVFLLNLFSNIFASVFDETFNFLVENKKEIHTFNNPRISKFKKDVGNLKFEHVWNSVLAEIEKEAPDSELRSELMNMQRMNECNVLFQKILRHLFQEIDIRCNCLNRLKFCDLLNCNSAGDFNLSSQLLTELMTEHGPFFLEEELKSEMTALVSNAIFCHKSVHELLEYFAELNLRNVFPQLYKLAEFILTLPFLPASSEKRISKLKDLNKCSYIPEANGIPSGEVSVLCVESEMLRDVKNSALFYEDVLSKFYEVNKSLLLVQV